MPGLGTLVNVLAIIAGGVGGLLFGRFLSERFQQTILMACGLVVVMLGLSGALTRMIVVGQDGALQTRGVIMLVASLALGAVIGELADLDRRFALLGEWLKRRSGNAGDARFVDAFVTASLTVCIGAMAVIGAIEDVLLLDHSILFTKAVIDLVIIMVMASSTGAGAVFSALSVGLFQGVISLLAGALQPILTEEALANLSYVGSVMILGIGINLIRGPRIRVANLLPGLVIAAAWAYV